MKKKLLFSACACMAVVLGLGCSEVNGVPSRAPSGYPEGPKTMVDAGATAITRTLYENLFVLAERGTMFGHQIPTLYGLDNNRKWLPVRYFVSERSVSSPAHHFLLLSRPYRVGI